MNTLLLRIIIPVLFVLFTSVGIVWQFHQITDLEKKTAADALQLNQYAATVTLLAENATAQQHNQQQLAVQQTRLQQQLHQRQQTIRNLQHENALYKNWADTELPAVVKRLRQRPALTSARDYQQYLSDVNAVPAAGITADTKRGSDQ